MKTITALTLFGILTLSCGTTTAQTPETECRNIAGKKDVDVNKFFSGTWYMTNIEKLYEPTYVCQEGKGEVLSDGTVKLLLSSYSEGKTPEFYRFECSTNEKNFVNGNAFFNCNVLTPTSVVQGSFGMNTTIVETDYDSYAVFHPCNKIKGVNYAGMFLVLSRSTSEPTNPKVKETLKNLGQNLDTYATRKSVTCKKDPNF